MTAVRCFALIDRCFRTLTKVFPRKTRVSSCLTRRVHLTRPIISEQLVSDCLSVAANLRAWYL